MKEKLSRIRAPWRRLLLSLVIACLAVLSKIKSRRAKVHWIGAHDRPRRRERMLIMFLILISALVLKPHQYVMWAAVWGGIASLYIILHSLVILARADITSGDWFDGDEQ